jgi:hypothetical protein
VEKFIQANTQELAKDKWLCPLSGKKFKGPEFVRKHIFNKHAEKVDEVKKEVRVLIKLIIYEGILHTYVTFSLCLPIKHDAMKICGGVEMWAPSILNLSTGLGVSGWHHTTHHLISEESAPGRRLDDPVQR